MVSMGTPSYTHKRCISESTKARVAKKCMEIKRLSIISNGVLWGPGVDQSYGCIQKHRSDSHVPIETTH